MSILDPGYRFVPLPSEARRVKRPSARHDRRVAHGWSGRILLDMVCEQPVHVGSGFKNLEQDDYGRYSVRRGAFTAAGRPGISGSTLKGVLRARFEAMTKSCLLFGLPDGVSADVQGLESCKASQDGAPSEAELCPACALFGMMSRRSRISIEDFGSHTGSRFEVARMREQFGPRAEKLIDRAGGLKGRKFAVGLLRFEEEQPAKELQVEVLPEGTQLSGGLRVLNLEAAELGGLLTALGMTPSSYLKVGGGKGLGFGRIKVTKVDLSRLSQPGSRDTPSPEESRRAFTASEDRHDEGERRLVEIHQKGC